MSASTGVQSTSMAHGDDVAPIDRLVVAWQHPPTRAIVPIGILDRETHNYRFRYLKRSLEIPDFRPFIGFPKLDEVYHSRQLFPLFRQRVMNTRRPDYPRYIKSLDLPASAGPWEQLARSGGQRVGDTIQLFPVPAVRRDGSTECCFLVHGIRHTEAQDPRVRAVIDALDPGDPLALENEPKNPKNPNAILVVTKDGVALGWVPDLLLDYVRVISDYSEITLTVEHVNRAVESTHFRLLVSMEGLAPDGYEPFSGPDWEFV